MDNRWSLQLTGNEQIDFSALKQRVSIEQAIRFLGLDMRRSGSALRGPCPACGTGGHRALVVTPSKQVFYCFPARQGGDQLALVAHIKGCGVRQAAEQLVARFGNSIPINRRSVGGFSADRFASPTKARAR
jgi:DNA primase